MKRLYSLLLAAFCLEPALLWADPPMKVIYNEKVSTKFTWHWPQHVVRTYSAVQTKPYYYTGRLLRVEGDITKYRYHYSYLASKREWGYYFEPGTYLYNGKPYPLFSKPRLWHETILNP